MPDRDLEAWLGQETPELVEAIASDLGRHVASLAGAGERIYGYAVLPGDYLTEPGAPSITVAFNRPSDIAPDHANSAYHRFCVDEWAHYENGGFDASNALLEEAHRQFKALHTPDPDADEIDDFEVAYIAKVHRAALAGLSRLKADGIFGEDFFLVLWIPDSFDDIMLESAKALNPEAVYEAFAAEFG